MSSSEFGVGLEFIELDRKFGKSPRECAKKGGTNWGQKKIKSSETNSTLAGVVKNVRECNEDQLRQRLRRTRSQSFQQQFTLGFPTTSNDYYWMELSWNGSTMRSQSCTRPNFVS